MFLYKANRSFRVLQFYKKFRCSDNKNPFFFVTFSSHLNKFGLVSNRFRVEFAAGYKKKPWALQTNISNRQGKSTVFVRNFKRAMFLEFDYEMEEYCLQIVWVLEMTGLFMTNEIN